MSPNRCQPTPSLKIWAPPCAPAAGLSTVLPVHSCRYTQVSLITSDQKPLPRLASL